MADAEKQSKIDAAAEKAYADAAAKTTSTAKVAEAVEADAPKADASAKAVKQAVKAPAKKPAAKKAPAKKAPAKTATTAKKAPARKAAAKTTAAKKAVAKKTPAKKAPAKKAPAKAAAKTTETNTNPLTKLKDTIMATAEKTDITAQAKEMAADVQTRAKEAYAKATELASDAGEFSKANVEAVVESGKILFNGTHEIVRKDIENVKSVAETVTEDAKKVAAVKTPTEFMQLQGEIARRNFDAVVSFGSQRTETIMKLYNDAFAPISNRVSVATDRFTKAA